MKNKFLAMLGFAQKSGNVINGDELVEKALYRGKISLVIISEDASKAIIKKYSFKCNELGIRCIISFDREILSGAIGKNNRTLYGIKNKKFSRELIKIYDSNGDS
ncbi:L7Ae/L30e/S12e/Gadd45 family ribosomal protein [Helicovermis profundi]|uniref:Ribosomal protein eL8/eL30/eS12/Gadd45 domain-containing protein n=1 Tax=Helicovermis profundi TaxID=3065157 RepID=A0AAU9EPP8_9FIRM|nr:hypothetical protein HLPR_16620 [Clostridia bacterium S502]